MNQFYSNKPLPRSWQLILGIVGIVVGLFGLFKAVFAEDTGFWLVFDVFVALPLGYLGYLLLFSNNSSRNKGLFSSYFLHFFGGFWLVATAYFAISEQDISPFAAALGVGSITLARSRK